MSTDNDHFFKHFVLERKKTRLSQEECAVKCGVGRQMWGKYERGETYPSSEVLINFAKLGADIACLFSNVQDIKHSPVTNSDQSDTHNMLINAFESADESAREALLTFADLILKSSKNK